MSVDVQRPRYKSKRCVNCQRGTWPGVSKHGQVWPDTVNCPLLAPALAAYNYVCKDHVRMTEAIETAKG